MVNTPAPLPFWWVEPLVIAAGVVVSILLAWFTIRDNRQLARLKATIDLIERSESDNYYKSLYLEFRKYRTDRGYQTGVLEPKNDGDWANRASCLDFLNHYELVAISIKKNILDENFYREWMGYAMVRDFMAAKGLVDIVRHPKQVADAGNVNAYCYLEALCKSWASKVF